MRTSEAVGAMACPVCRTGLALADRGGVEIDYCPTCRGVWLDRGELDKIIDRTALAMPEDRSPRADRVSGGKGGLMGIAAALMEDGGRHRHRDDRGYDRDRHRKRRKSILSEFFD